MQERFVLLEGVPAGGLGAAQGCLQSALGAWRPAPRVRGTAQRGMGTATPGCLSDPLCHRLLPLPRGTFSEINGHVESIFVRLYRFYTNETIGSRAKERELRGEQCARAAMVYAGFVAELRTVSPCHSRACRPQHATAATAPVTLQDEHVGTCAPQPSASCGRLPVGSCHGPDGAHCALAGCLLGLV